MRRRAGERREGGRQGGKERRKQGEMQHTSPFVVLSAWSPLLPTLQIPDAPGSVPGPLVLEFPSQTASSTLGPLNTLNFDHLPAPGALSSSIWG